MESLFEECSKRGMKPWLDCARSYGLSEKFVGEFLRSNQIAPSDVYVSSKWGYTYVADWNVSLEKGKPHEVKDHSISVSTFKLYYIILYSLSITIMFVTHISKQKISFVYHLIIIIIYEY